VKKTGKEMAQSQQRQMEPSKVQNWPQRGQ